MADGSSTRSLGRLAGFAYLAIILFSSAGYFATTRLLTGDLRTPLGCGADIGEFGACLWLLVLTPGGPNAPARP